MVFSLITIDSPPKSLNELINPPKTRKKQLIATTEAMIIATKLGQNIFEKDHLDSDISFYFKSLLNKRGLATGLNFKVNRISFA